MAWNLDFESAAVRDFGKLDRRVAERVGRYLRERLCVADDPRRLGAPLKGPNFHTLWRFRVGDHRIVARIEDEAVTILVVRVGHRREVYRP